MVMSGLLLMGLLEFLSLFKRLLKRCQVKNTPLLVQSSHCCSLKVTLKVSDSDSLTNKRIKEVVKSDLSMRYDESCIQQLLNVVMSHTLILGTKTCNF